jgi:hypothetical protein
VELEARVNILFRKPTEGELQNLPNNVNPEDCQDWHNKPSMKKCIVEIEKSRDLKEALMNRNDQLEAIKAENAIKADILTTLKEANKSSTKDVYTDKNYIIMKNDMVKKKLKEESSQIEKCEEFLQNSTLITDKTRLIVSSICKIMGQFDPEQEMKYLNSKDKMIDVSTFNKIFFNLS